MKHLHFLSSQKILSDSLLQSKCY